MLDGTLARSRACQPARAAATARLRAASVVVGRWRAREGDGADRSVLGAFAAQRVAERPQRGARDERLHPHVVTHGCDRGRDLPGVPGVPREARPGPAEVGRGAGADADQQRPGQRRGAPDGLSAEASGGWTTGSSKTSPTSPVAPRRSSASRRSVSRSSASVGRTGTEDGSVLTGQHGHGGRLGGRHPGGVELGERELRGRHLGWERHRTTISKGPRPPEREGGGLETWGYGPQPTTSLRASPSAPASSALSSTTSRPPPSRGTLITMPRPSLVTSSGPSPVRGFMAAMCTPLPISFVRRTRPTGSIIPHGWQCLGQSSQLMGQTRPRAGWTRPRQHPGGSMSETVEYAVDGGVATIRLSRPEAMNGLDVATKEALLDAVRRAAGDDEVRCVVLTGSGRAFCVGQDLKEHISHPAELRRGVSLPHGRGALQPDRQRDRVDGQAGRGRRQRGGGRCRREPGVRLRPARPEGVGGLQPGLHRGRALLRHRRVVDPAPPRRPHDGDGPALLPADPRLRGVARARPGDARGAGRRVRRRRRRAGDAAGRRADRRLRCDPAFGGLLRLPRLRGLTRPRGDDDDADGVHRGPPRRRGRVRAEAEAAPTTGADASAGGVHGAAAGRWVRSSAPGDGSPPGRTPR